MKKWLSLLIMTLVLASILSATTFKVAILPLKRLDSASKYIQKFLTIRDLQRTFDKNEKYDLLDMKETAEAFKDMDIPDIDEMEKEDMAEVGKELKADVLILGTISAGGYNNNYEQTFQCQFRFYSIKTDDLTSQRVDVVKAKKKRWNTLDTEFMGKLNTFISDELNKMKGIAIQDYHAENYKQAEQGFNNVLSYDPNIRDAYYYLGMIAYNQKDYPKAVTNLNKAMPDTLKLSDSKILQGLVNTYRDMGNKNMEISSLSKLAELQNDEELWLNVANLYAENRQNTQAKESLQKALAINENFKKAQYRMGFLLYDMGEYSEAIKYLETAADDNPNSDIIARRLAISYQKAGRISDAIGRYETIVKNNPTNNIAYLNLSGLYRTAAGEASDKNDQALVNEYNNKALTTLNNLKQFDAENALVYLRLADVYLAMSNFKEAQINAQIAISKDNNLYQPYIILSSISQRDGSNRYNQFIEYEKIARESFGNKAKQYGKMRDAARIDANGLFRKADEQLRSARVRTNEPEVISDIDNKLAVLSQLIAQSGSIY